jgi:hypothetical protein
MSTFANVYVGAAANDGTGDPLRNAFLKIDQNFANIATASNSSPVTSVAGRTGNIVLSINDVFGAASTYYVANYVAAGNAYVDSQIAALGNIDVVALTSEINVLNANVGVISNEITELFSNASTQSNSLGSLATDVSNINAELIAQQNSITTLTANAIAQSLSIDNINNNIAGIENNLVTLFTNSQRIDANVGAYEIWANAEFVTTNTNIITANTGMKAYVDQKVIGGIGVVTQIGNIAVNDQTMTGTNDGLPLTIGFPNTQFTGATIFEGILTANAVSDVTNTNVGSIQVPNGGIGVAGSIYCATLPDSRIQVGTGGQLLPNVLGQFTSNVASYAQLNMQNLNHGPLSSSDFVATANNGDDSSYFIDMGIASSTYEFPEYPGYKPNDGYLLVNGGNLLLNTDTTDKTIRFLVGGHADSDQVGQFSASGLSVTGDLDVTGNISFTMGNITNWTSPVTTIGAALDQLAARLKAAGF